MSTNSENNDKGSACSCGGGSCCSGPGRWIWIGMMVAIAAVLIAKNAEKRDLPTNTTTTTDPSVVVEASGIQGTQESAGNMEAIPRLIDLGATKCIPCKMMAPILEELKSACVGKLDVQFIDVWENPDAAKQYGINMIPTQIFYDAGGTELFRHEGFFGKEDIIAKWKEFGVDLGSTIKSE